MDRLFLRCNTDTPLNAKVFMYPMAIIILIVSIPFLPLLYVISAMGNTITGMND